MTETPKACRGCFREWEAENTVCPYCGWNPSETYDAVMGWTVGEAFEKRYLLGLLYCRMPDIAVWRIYDTVLGICFLALRTTSQDEDALYLLAERIRTSELLAQNHVILMAIKSLGAKNVLFFSIKEYEKNPEILKKVLSEKMQQEKAAAICETPGFGQQKEQALMAGTMLGSHYQILGCIGIGGFGMIYLCKDLALQRLIAVKEYFPMEWANREEQQYVAVKKSKMVAAFQFGLKSFYKEAQIMAKFIHMPHVVTIYDVMEKNDTAYLIMEYISGVSIGREMRARNYQPYQVQEVIEILLPVLDALGEFHEKKVIHSDISPGNIMRSKKGEIFLIDMGAAKYALHSQPILSAAFLKPEYAAPEQYRTAKEGVPKDEGPWTDVYSLGATIYYLLTGQKPPDVMQRLNGKKSDVLLPRKCRLKNKKQWAKFLNHAMALEIGERIHSVEEFWEEMNFLK